jgi:hypothetical protein
MVTTKAKMVKAFIDTKAFSAGSYNMASACWRNGKNAGYWVKLDPLVTSEEAEKALREWAEATGKTIYSMTIK